MHKFCHARSFLPSLSICSSKEKKNKKQKTTDIKLSGLHLVLIAGRLLIISYKPSLSSLGWQSYAGFFGWLLCLVWSASACASYCEFVRDLRECHWAFISHSFWGPQDIVNCFKFYKNKKQTLHKCKVALYCLLTLIKFPTIILWGKHHDLGGSFLLSCVTKGGCLFLAPLLYGA